MDLLSSNSGQAGLKAVRMFYGGGFHNHCNKFSKFWQSKITNQVLQEHELKHMGFFWVFFKGLNS